jgi:hypothetical protein
MKHFIVSVFCVVLVAAGAAAAQPPYREGNRTVSFHFNGANLNGYDGGIGGKYWTSDEWAIVGSLDFSYRKDDRDSSDDNYNENTNYGGGLYLGLEKHFGTSRFTPYLAGVFGGGYDSGYRKVARNNGESVDEFDTGDTWVAVRAVFGLEMWLTSRFSLGGEYRVHAIYSDGWSETRTTREPPVPPARADTSVWQAAVGSSTLLLSVYF